MLMEFKLERGAREHKLEGLLWPLPLLPSENKFKSFFLLVYPHISLPCTLALKLKHVRRPWQSISTTGEG